MHKHGSTSFEDRLRADFISNPVGMWVVLPDGSLAIVKFLKDGLYKVQGIHRDGRFRALGTLSCWYSIDELRLHYWSASVAA